MAKETPVKTALRRIPRAAVALAALVAAWSTAADARSLSGAYLAAKQAADRNDLAAAATYYSAALSFDPDDDALRERALNFNLMAGDMNAAGTLARAMVAVQPSHRVSNLVLVVEEFNAAEFAAAVERMDGLPEGFSPLLAMLLKGWASVGLGDAEMLEAALGGEDESRVARVFSGYHLGLARAALGDLEGADAALSALADDDGAADGRLARAHGAVLERLGRADEARELYEAALAERDSDPLLEAELARLDAGEPPSLPVRTARSGAAEAMFTIAGALGREQGGAAALIYAQLAIALRPELHAARLLAANMLEAQGQLELAAKTYSAVPRTSPLFRTAEIGRADALRQLERQAEAILALEALAREHPRSLEVQLALGDLLRREERWTEAAAAYTSGIDLIPEVEQRHWAVFYQRGIAHERGGAWDAAEADFMAALELVPDQPLVLNYLGYSWVEQRRNFDEAQGMIERAVEQRPEDGYITDSLGWVLYRIGKFDEAVPHLERAVELAPVDPIVNDHLGDALWMVGRRLEARFQWRRALSFEPEDEDADRIRRKLDKGLDAVLRDEEAGENATVGEPGADDARDDG